jgi:hypothetical protein
MDCGSPVGWIKRGHIKNDTLFKVIPVLLLGDE